MAPKAAPKAAPEAAPQRRVRRRTTEQTVERKLNNAKFGDFDDHLKHEVKAQGRTLAQRLRDDVRRYRRPDGTNPTLGRPYYEALANEFKAAKMVALAPVPAAPRPETPPVVRQDLSVTTTHTLNSSSSTGPTSVTSSTVVRGTTEDLITFRADTAIQSRSRHA